MKPDTLVRVFDAILLVVVPVGVGTAPLVAMRDRVKGNGKQHGGASERIV